MEKSVPATLDAEQLENLMRCAAYAVVHGGGAYMSLMARFEREFEEAVIGDPKQYALAILQAKRKRAA